MRYTRTYANVTSSRIPKTYVTIRTYSGTLHEVRVHKTRQQNPPTSKSFVNMIIKIDHTDNNNNPVCRIRAHVSVYDDMCESSETKQQWFVRTKKHNSTIIKQIKLMHETVIRDTVYLVHIALGTTHQNTTETHDNNVNNTPATYRRNEQQSLQSSYKQTCQTNTPTHTHVHQKHMWWYEIYVINIYCPYNILIGFVCIFVWVWPRLFWYVYIYLYRLYVYIHDCVHVCCVYGRE